MSANSKNQFPPPATLNDVEPITLAGGDELDRRQTLAVILHVRGEHTSEEIAELAGYSGPATLNGFLRSRRGQEGVRKALIQHLNDAARIGLQTMVKLAQSARSENVRQLAAADLMNRARIQIEQDGPVGPAREGGVNITFNLPEGTRPEVKEIPAEIPPRSNREGG